MCYHLRIVFRCGHCDYGRVCRYITNATMADCSQHPRMSSGFPLPPIGVHLAGYDCLPCARKVYNRGLMRLWTETVEARKAAWDRFQASADPHTADGFIRACSDLGWVQGWTTVQLAEFRESYIPKLYEEALRQVEAMEEVTGVLTMGTGRDTNGCWP